MALIAGKTRLGLYGGPRAPYAGFAAAVGTKAYTKTFVRHALHGGIRMPYGDFSLKVAAVAVPSGVKPAGRAKKPRRYQIVIDNQVFDVRSVEEANALLAAAVELASSKATADIATAGKRIRRRKLNAQEALAQVELPKISTAHKALKPVVLEAQKEIHDTYSRIARNTEMEFLIRRKIQEEDEEEAIIALLLN